MAKGQRIGSGHSPYPPLNIYGIDFSGDPGELDCVYERMNGRHLSAQAQLERLVKTMNLPKKQKRRDFFGRNESHVVRTCQGRWLWSVCEIKPPGV